MSSLLQSVPSAPPPPPLRLSVMRDGRRSQVALVLRDSGMSGSASEVAAVAAAFGRGLKGRKACCGCSCCRPGCKRWSGGWCGCRCGSCGCGCCCMGSWWWCCGCGCSRDSDDDGEGTSDCGARHEPPMAWLVGVGRSRHDDDDTPPAAQTPPRPPAAASGPVLPGGPAPPVGTDQGGRAARIDVTERATRPWAMRDTPFANDGARGRRKLLP
eukprot:365944-Chlamydomonas_euryale.AAC.1